MIRTGDTAVDFDLPAGNAEGSVSLAEHRARGPLLVVLFRERRTEPEPKCLDDIIKLIRADMYGRRSTDLDTQELRRIMDRSRKAKGLE